MNRSDSLRRDRSFDSVLNKLMRMRSQNHESFKAAMYNFLIAAGIGAFVAVCFILGPFVKPLIWAFLIGAVLFPFKRKLAQLLNGWFERIEANDTNVFIALCLSPLEASEYCGSLVVNWLRMHWQLLSGIVGAATFIKLLFLYAPKGLLCAIWSGIVLSHTLFVEIIGYVNIYVLLTIIITYLTTVYFFWTPESSTYFVVAGQSLWLVIAGYGCSFLGALQVPAFILILLYVGASIVYHLRTLENSSTFVQNLRKLLDKGDFEASVCAVTHETLSKKSSLQSEVDEVSLSETMDSLDTVEVTCCGSDEPHLSDTYFKFLLYACMATFLYRNVWMCILAAIPVLLHLLYTLSSVTGLTGFIRSKINDVFEQCKVGSHFTK